MSHQQLSACPAPRAFVVLAACVSTLCFVPISLANTKHRLAVMPVETLNLEQNRRQGLERLLSQRLIATKAFTLVSPVRLADADLSPECTSQPSCVQRLAKKLKTRRLVQLRVGALGQTYIVRLGLFDGRSGTRIGSWQEVLPRIDSSMLIAAFDRMIAGFTPRVAKAASPWYTRWWFWTGVAGAVTAATVTAVVIASQSSSPSADVIITPP